MPSTGSWGPSAWCEAAFKKTAELDWGRVHALASGVGIALPRTHPICPASAPRTPGRDRRIAGQDRGASGARAGVRVSNEAADYTEAVPGLCVGPASHAPSVASLQHRCEPLTSGRADQGAPLQTSREVACTGDED